MGLQKNKRELLGPAPGLRAPGLAANGNLLSVNASGDLTDSGIASAAVAQTPVGSSQLDASVAQAVTVSLTAANIIAMNGAPVSVIAAPGAGKAIIFDDALFEFTPGGTQFTSGGAVSLVYHGGSTAAHSGTIPASVVTSASASNTMLGPATAANGTTVPTNAGIDITNATAAFATGNGTAKVFIRYRVVTL